MLAATLIVSATVAGTGCATLFGKHPSGAESAGSVNGDSLPAGDTASAPTATAWPTVEKAASGGKDETGKSEPPSGPVTTTDLETLEKMGPVYTPADVGALLAPGDWLGELLEDTLVPVIKKYHLSPDRAAYYWVLVDDQGEVADAVLHTPSGQAAFDQAARAAALHLHYVPARRDGQRVPVWILVRVSLLMR